MWFPNEIIGLKNMLLMDTLKGVLFKALQVKEQHLTALYSIV